MDIIETISTMFEDLLPHVIECHGDADAVKALFDKTKRAIICAASSNPLNTCYMLDVLRPMEHCEIAI